MLVVDHFGTIFYSLRLFVRPSEMSERLEIAVIHAEIPFAGTKDISLADGISQAGKLTDGDAALGMKIGRRSEKADP